MTLDYTRNTLVSLSIVPIMFKRLVLPPPELPRMITNYPYLILTVPPLKAATPYNPNRYVLCISYPDMILGLSSK